MKTSDALQRKKRSFKYVLHLTSIRFTQCKFLSVISIEIQSIAIFLTTFTSLLDNFVTDNQRQLKPI